MNAKTINRVAMLAAIAPIFFFQSSLAQEVASESQVAAAEADSALNRLSFSQWVKDFEKQFAPIGRPDPATGRTFYKSKAMPRNWYWPMKRRCWSCR